MKVKSAIVIGCCLVPASVFAGGVDMNFFGYKVCDVSFDANPFSRDDGRPKSVCFTQTAVQYYTPPPRVASPSAAVVSSDAQSSAAAVRDDPSIVIKDSSNVTIVNQESRRTNQSMYAPSVSYPTTNYTTYPAYYASPTYYVYPSSYYYRPYGYGYGYGYGCPYYGYGYGRWHHW